MAKTLKSVLGVKQRKIMYLRIEFLLRTTNWNYTRIADDVSISSSTVQRYARSTKIPRPKSVKQTVLKTWKAPKVVEGHTRRYVQPGRLTLREEERKEATVRRAHEVKVHAKIVDLYVKHSVEADSIAERFGLSKPRVWEIIKAGRPEQAGPGLANQ